MGGGGFTLGNNAQLRWLFILFGNKWKSQANSSFLKPALVNKLPKLFLALHINTESELYTFTLTVLTGRKEIYVLLVGEIHSSNSSKKNLCKLEHMGWKVISFFGCPKYSCIIRFIVEIPMFCRRKERPCCDCAGNYGWRLVTKFGTEIVDCNEEQNINNNGNFIIETISVYDRIWLNKFSYLSLHLTLKQFTIYPD